MNGLTLLEHISIIREPRQEWKITHKLSEILFLAITATIAGSEGWDEISDFGEDNIDWLRKFSRFENGVPSYHTIARVFSAMNPKEFQKAFIAWMNDCHEATHGDIIAIDGKRVRGSYNQSDKSDAIHMVSAFAAGNEVVLGQIKTDRKSNEITAIPKLLKLLDIRGCLITIDAMGCQTKIAKQVVDGAGDYLLAVKGNQPKLLVAMNKVFSISELESATENVLSQTEKGHGREKTRHHMVTHDLTELGDIAFEWPELKSLGYIVSFRTEKGKTTEASFRFYISSAKLSVQEFANAAREHWSIEVKLHWKLDTALNEDACRIRRENSAENYAIVRHTALNLLNADKTLKASIKRKQKRANRNTDYINQVLTGQGAS
jgi:predicted transposase YbfD/YdcC